MATASATDSDQRVAMGRPVAASSVGGAERVDADGPGNGYRATPGDGSGNVDAATVAEARAYTDTVATQTLSSANAYTDQQFAVWNDNFEAFRGDVERRFHDVDRRLDRQGAMGAAMLNMATSAAGIRTQNRVGVGVGFQGGESALSVGYQRAISDRATITFGGAISGDESSVGIGAGFGW